MRERLPQVGEVFAAGDIDFRMFATIVYRTDLITDPDVLARVDAQLAVKVARWPSMTRARLAGQVDKIVAKADADAVRRARPSTAPTARCGSATSRAAWREIEGSLFSPDAHALDKRLNALAATVCAHDPRTARAAPRRCAGGAGGRGGSAGVSLRTPRLRRRHAAGPPPRW